jgi:alginate O-acetyltransferase complex protein AlgJ
MQRHSLTAPDRPADHPELKPITQVEKRTSKVAGPCLLLFMLCGLLGNIFFILSGNLSLQGNKENWSAFINGDLTEQINISLSKAAIPVLAAQIERNASWIVLSDLGTRVREGKRDWLFLNDERVIYSDRQVNALARANEVIGLRDRLASQSIALIVIVVPDKSRVESDSLADLLRPESLRLRVEQWVDSLSTAGITVVNLTDPLKKINNIPGSHAFMRTDTHWNEAGAQTAAKFIAERILSSGFVASPSVERTISDQMQQIHEGDLVKLAGINHLPAPLRPHAEMVRRTSFAPRAHVSGTQDEKTLNDDLFGDTQLPNIVLLGTSYSTSSNFAHFLEYSLKTNIANFAKEGGDFSGSVNAYLKSTAFKETPPKMIIWEIPERMIETDHAWDHLNQ